MPQATKDTVAAADLIKAAWKKYAATASFGGLTEAQYEAKVQPSYDLRTQITETQEALAQMIRDRDLVDKASDAASQSVVKGMVGDVNYGDDSDLYGACGYIRKSQKKSGLTQKKNNASLKKAA